MQGNRLGMPIRWREKGPEARRHREFPLARFEGHLGLVASASGHANARAAAARRLALVSDGRTLRAFGARPSRESRQPARFAARWLRFGYAGEGKGIGRARQSLVIVGAGSRNRTHDQRFTKPSEGFVILLHHQLLTASAHLRHRSRMQRNAKPSNSALLRFRLQSHCCLGGCSAARCEIDAVG